MNRKFFPGGNTGEGFINLFEGITPSWEPVPFTFILKGGPGVGKSTLMKRIADTAEKAGIRTEEFRCASDPDSFDAVRLPKNGIVILDGTAPHSIDPSVPGAGQEIINLGHFKNQNEFIEKYSDIKRIFDENKYHYKIAYSYLKAAAELKTTAIDAAAQMVNLPLVRYCIEDFISSDFKDEPAVPRKLFASAITPDGVIDFSGSCVDRGICVNIGGVFGYVFLREVMSILKGTRAQFFMDSILPHVPDIVVMPGGATVFAVTKEADSDIDHRELMTGAMPGFIDYNMSKVKELTDKAIDQLKACKELHDKIEEIYRPYVDYQHVDYQSDILLSRIF